MLGPVEMDASMPFRPGAEAGANAFIITIYKRGDHRQLGAAVPA